MIDLAKIAGFDWDEGNARKNEKHGESMAESEQVFFNSPLLFLEDTRHSRQEPRFHALGKTDTLRVLHITFTLRRNGELLRVISARDMHRKDRLIYEKVT
ncbi:MAG: BrnT family toxin [Xanthomonadales bacterium]|nr:BrnT family toxin [Xanthomonadales bacterium]